MHSNEKQPYRALLTGKRMLVITATGDAGYQSGGPLEYMNHLDPHIRTAFAFIGITDIEFIRVNYDEFPDGRFTRSLATAEAAIIQFAHEQAEIWSGQVTSICAVAVR